MADEEKIELTPEEIALCRGDDCDLAEVSDGAAPQDDGAVEEAEVKEGNESGKDAGAGSGAEAESEAGQNSGHPEWLDEEAIALATIAGLSLDDAKEFGSKDVVRKYAVSLAAAIAAQKQPASGEQKPAAGTAADPEKPAAGTAAAPEKPARRKIDPELFRREGYNDEIVAMAEELRAMQDQAEASMPAVHRFNEAFEASRRHLYVNEFHDVLDGLDADVFGRSKSESGEVAALAKSVDDIRRRVWEESERIIQDAVDAAKARGVAPSLPPRNTIIVRAANALFGSELVAAESRRRTEKLRGQSQRRRPSAGRPSSSGHGAVKTRTDDPKEIANLPEVRKFWDEAQAANGTE